ncbi:MAG: DUF2330 domain-containing protein [Myxococcales bacterium]|nr:DUF2330 domain-containing protein [Myxococcales bacterium]
MRCVLPCPAVVVSALALAAVALPVREVAACGGCFVPASQSAVVQDAERILFAFDPATKSSVVWVEIRYNGPANDFGWVLPLPKKPEVSVGSAWLFDRLDVATAPRFDVTTDSAQENCGRTERSSGGGCGAADFNGSAKRATSAGGAFAAEVDANGKPAVSVLEHSQTGPYDYQIIAGTSGDAVQTWLDARGYKMPALAKDVLDAHVKKGDVFVAVKLLQGVGAKEIRPIVLKMTDAEPCVPLRLTAIAAADNMAVQTYIAGPGRAIPKNYLHVRVNDLRINWFAPQTNYGQVVAAAIDEAAGHAFVTEFAGKLPKKVAVPQRFGGSESEAFVDEAQLDTAKIATAKNAKELIVALRASNFPITAETAAEFEKLTGLAKAAKQTDQLVAFWSGAHEGTALAIDIKLDGAALAKKLEAEFVQPIKTVLPLLLGADRFTRMVLRIDPKEMTKDPVFAYHKTLPDVANVRKATVRQVCRKGDYQTDAWRLTLDGLGTWVVDLQTGAPFTANQFPLLPNTAKDARFQKTPAAAVVELLDETGDPRPIDPSQIELVDAAISGAQAGKPSLDAAFSLKKAATRFTPPASDALVQSAAAGSGCGTGWTGDARATMGGLLALAVAVLLWMRRRRTA